MSTKKIRSYLALGVISVALVVIVSAASKAFSQLEFSYPAAPGLAEVQLVAVRAQMNSEEIGKTCQPEGAADLTLIAEETGEHDVFQVWRMTIDGQLVERTTTLFGTACGLANDSRYIRFPYEYVPREVAENLSIQVLRYNVDTAGGLEAYRTRLIENLQPDGMSGGILPRFSSIDVQAWEEVGLTVPSDLYEVIEYQESEPYGS
ncbi:MAG: hypothetical protein WBD47_02215 [Phormidesmis sp.]